MMRSALPARSTTGLALLATAVLLTGCTSAAGEQGAPSAAVTTSPPAGSAAAGTTASSPSGTTGATTPTLEERTPDVVPASELPAGRIDEAVAQLPGLAESIMERSGIPGMAVAVVHDGEVLFAQGYGVRELGRPETVDADTVFQIASMSKPLGATVVAHEVAAGTVSWDDPVVEHLPSFALADPWVTEHVTIGDLYSHRSGLPEHAGDKLEDMGYDQQEILQRLRLEPLDEFRNSYHYTNFGLTAAAESVAAAAGEPWPDLAREALYQPLGMTSTSSTFADYQAAPNRAVTHERTLDGEFVADVVRQPDAQSPAGGVSSTANDLTKWMITVLGDGTGPEGQPIADLDAMLPALTPQSKSGPAGDPAARSGFYGFGMNVGVTPTGRTQLSHSGAFNAGTGTSVVMLPGEDLGIVTLTNAAPIGVPEALNQEFLDLVQYGEPRFDWWSLYNRGLTSIGLPQGELVGETPPADPAPAPAADALVGTYDNDFHGPLEIAEQGDGLVLTIGPARVEYPLTHWDGATFTLAPRGEMANAGSISAVEFTGADGGRAASVTVEYFDEDGLGTFQR